MPSTSSPASRASGTGALGLVFVVLAAACSGGGGAGDSAASGPADSTTALTPVFEPATSTTTEVPTSSPGPPVPSNDTSAAETPTTTTTLTVVQGGGPARSASVTDPEGDVSLAVERPPPWVDLVGATLTLDDSGFELRVRLGGGDAPEAAGGDHTMNVASFYDTDGDGRVEHEVWLNLGPDGWGAGWFSPAGARYADDSGVMITTEGGEVVARFPGSHLGEASEFRWSLASEWGRYETVGTDLAARDRMPDDGRPVNFRA